MNSMNTHRKFAVAVGLMVAAVVGVGLYVAGSPGKERERKIDDTRLSDLQMISSAVDAYYAKNASLPGSLEALVTANKNDWYVRAIVDPQTGMPYEYLTTGEKSYQLCAVFTLASDMTDPNAPVARPVMAPYPGVPGYPNWTHPAGRHCFDLTINIYPGPGVACGLTNPCAAGQTCASLPDGKGTYCVPTGKECQAAGCPGSCSIAESYPVQIFCDEVGPTEQEPTSQCTLMKETKTGKVDCYGCGRTVCKTPPAGWEEYVLPPDYMGIPYACYDGPDGCELAQ